MQRLGMWASAYDCAVVLIGHLNKKEGTEDLYRSIGSVDVVAAARSVLQMEHAPENKDIRIVRQIKNNLAPSDGEIRFSITAEEGFRWLECKIPTDPEAESEPPKFESKSEKAADLIKKLLSDGDMRSREIYMRMSDEGISRRTAENTKREDLYLRELNLNFIQSFHTFLRIDKGMAQNSSTKHLKLLKKIVNLAVANSYMATNPFITYKIEREPVEIDFLDEEELRKIINFDTPLPRLERAKDMFLFGCFTGLSYIDIKTLAPEHFEKDNTGRIWIKKRRVKTGVLSPHPLLPIAKLILDSTQVERNYFLSKTQQIEKESSMKLITGGSFNHVFQ